MSLNPSFKTRSKGAADATKFKPEAKDISPHFTNYCNWLNLAPIEADGNSVFHESSVHVVKKMSC